MPKLQFYKPPDIETGYIFNPQKSYFSIVIPEQGTNLVYNPEVATLNFFNTVSGSIVLNSQIQLYGQNSLQAALNSTGYVYHLLQTTLVPNTQYTFSVYVLGNAGSYRLELIDGTTLAVRTASPEFKPDRTNWTRIQMTFNSNLIPTVNGVRLAIRKMNPGAGILISDGWQLENKPYATTFISGSQEGLIVGEVPRPYYWVATPHQSPSVRSQQTRDGGKIVSLEEYGFQVTGFNGFGLPKFDPVAVPIANGIGSLYQGSSIEDREVEICGVLMSCSIKDFFCDRANLSHGLSPSLVSKPQPTKLIYQVYDCETPICRCAEGLVVYEQGLEGEIESLVGEEICISFRMYDPLFKLCGNRSVELDVYRESNDFVMAPIGTDLNGEWKPMDEPSYETLFGDGGFGSTGDVNELTIGPDNNLYVGTDGFGAAVPGNSVGRWNGIAWELIGKTFMMTAPGVYVPGGEIFAIEKGADGKIYVGGFFDGIGTNAVNPPPVRVELGAGGTLLRDTLSFARYNILSASWEYIGRFRNNLAPEVLNSVGRVRGLKLLQNGKMAIVGSFSVPQQPVGVATVAARNAVLYDYVTNTFEFIAPLANNILGSRTDEIYTVAEAPNNNIWIGGAFSFAGTTPPFPLAENVAVLGLFNSGGFDAVGGSFTDANLICDFGIPVRKIVIAQDGTVYAGGDFTATRLYETLHPPNIFLFPPNIPVYTTTDPDFDDPANNSAAYSVAKLVRSSGRYTWSQLGILGMYDNVINPGVPTNAHIHDMKIDRNGKLHIVGQIEFANTYFPDRSFLNIVPSFLYPDLVLTDALSTQTPNCNGYVIWDGSQFIIPDFLVDMNIIGVGQPDLFLAIEVGDIFGADYTTDTLTPTIPGFSYQLPGTGGAAINPGFQGSAFVGPAQSYQLRSKAINLVDLQCNDYSRPIFTINGPGILRSIRNESTGATIFFNEYELAVGETLTLDLTQPLFKLVSNLKGNLRGIILPNSNLNSFILNGGVTNFSVNLDLSTIVDNVSGAFLKWREQYWDIGMSCECCTDLKSISGCNNGFPITNCPTSLGVGLTLTNPGVNCDLTGNVVFDGFAGQFEARWTLPQTSGFTFTYNSQSVGSPLMGLSLIANTLENISSSALWGIVSVVPINGVFVYVSGSGVTYTMTITGGGIYRYGANRLGISTGTTVTVQASSGFSIFRFRLEDAPGNNPSFTLTNVGAFSNFCWTF